MCKTQKQLTHHKHYHKYYLNGPQIFCQICDKNIPEKLFIRHVDTVHPGKVIMYKSRVELSLLKFFNAIHIVENYYNSETVEQFVL